MLRGLVAPDEMSGLALKELREARRTARRAEDMRRIALVEDDLGSVGDTSATCLSEPAEHKAEPIQWTAAHGFYANMGGFSIKEADGAPVSLSASRLFELCEQGSITLPIISKAAIQDKSKANYFVKTLACVQASWFVAQVIGRAV